MCVTHVYVDRYPDGFQTTFRRTLNCQYGKPGRPCTSHSTIEEPVRNINWGEVTTEAMFTRSFQPPQQRPHTPPRSPGGSHGRHSSSESSGHRRTKPSKRLSPLRPTRQHKKERIVIVDSPPTPRTPPQHFNQTFTAPSSPASPAYRTFERERGRPIIVDERPLRRNPSLSAVVSDRHTPRNSRSHSRSRHVMWDSPSNSHTSFNTRLRLEEEELARAREREAERQMRKDLEARVKAEKERDDRRRKEEFIRRQDEEIRSRPVVPLPPMPSRRPVVQQVDTLPVMMGGLSVEDDRRREDNSEEAMKRRLRERQLPKRRFSVGPGFRRHRVAYDDGMYRWE